MWNLKKMIIIVLLAIAISPFYLISFSVRADEITLCEKTFAPPITDALSFAEAMTKGMYLSSRNADLWNLYRNNWFGNPYFKIGDKELSDVLQILKQYPELSKLPVQEQNIQFSKEKHRKDEDFTHLLNRFRRVNLNKINNLYQIESHLNFWTTMMIYPKMTKQNSVSKAQRKNLKRQYNQEFLAYLENFINSEQRQFIADSSNDYRTRAVVLYRALEKIRAVLEEKGKNTIPVSRAMVDVVETVGFINEFYLSKLKSSNVLENIEGLKSILVERDILAFDLGFQKERFTAFKDSLLKHQNTDEFNEKTSYQAVEYLMEIVEETAEQVQDIENTSEFLRLRALSLQESAFRSCLGGDCTTRMFFQLAFDPNFLFFTLTDNQHRSSGQITIVLGEAVNAEGKVVKTAFVDNIHNVPVKKIYPMLEGISLSLSEYGYKLSFLKNVDLYNSYFGLSNDSQITDYVKTQIRPHLTRELTQFKPHPNDYPFQETYYRGTTHNSIHKKILVEFDTIDQQNNGFKIRPGNRYTPKKNLNKLNVHTLYAEVLALLQNSTTEEGQIKFLNNLSAVMNVEGLSISKRFVKNHLTSVIQDEEASFKLKKLSLYTLIKFELEHEEILNISFIESHLEYFTASEQNSIIGEMSTWKNSHQDYKRAFIAVLQVNLWNHSNKLTNLLKPGITFLKYIFLEAIRNNNRYVIGILLKNKIDLNMRIHLHGYTPLYLAVYYRDIRTTRLLLEAGADPNIPSYAFAGGGTPLQNSLNASLDTARLLLEYGADPNIPDSKGNTALHDAMDESIEQVQLFLEYGADPNIPNLQGNTALHDAMAMDGSIEQVQLLIEYGADPNIPNSEGHTAFALARIIHKGKIDLLMYWLKLKIGLLWYSKVVSPVKKRYRKSK